MIGINPPLILRDDETRVNINKMKFALFNNITQELSYMAYEGKFDINAIKDMTPYERSQHLNYMIKRIKEYNDSLPKNK